MSGKRVCKYIVKALLFSILLIKIIVFSMLPMSPMFSNIKKLRSLKPKLLIRTMVYVIFGGSKNVQYGHIEVLRICVFRTYSSVFGFIVAKTIMIGFFGNINQRISI